jgi:hypothetical protein
MFDVNKSLQTLLLRMKNEISIFQIPDGMIILSHETRVIFKSEFFRLKFRMTSTQTENIFQNKEAVKTPPEKKCGLMVG